LHDGKDAEKASTEEGGNLPATLPLSIGARVMLLENIWTERGLVNGAFGVVHDIVWRAEDGDPRRNPPFALLIKFDNYSGSSLVTTEDAAIIVPIFKSTREFNKGNASCTRIQFPIALAYAITIHKAQGLTVKRAVLNIANRDFTPGLTYVAVSRVETLNGVLFEESFDFVERFKRRVTKTAEWREQDANRRRKEHV
jgi:ATP-dependent exoDNAse (exonuclease V) alpha subunit